jgi:transposase
MEFHRQLLGSAFHNTSQDLTVFRLNSAIPDRAAHDKLAANYLAFIQLASIRFWLQV